MNSPEIILNDASVYYPPCKQSSLFELLSRKKTEDHSYCALKKINLHLLRGERLGLIGLNGAGKSTLLKIMAKIYYPTSGSCHVRGKICPLFEFATGFEMDMSGWANIKIRAKLLGMSPLEIKEKLKEIADFTELGEFLDYPVRTYSSGMFIRLAFAISTAITPEILLLDEVVGAGDMSFTKKAARRMESFMEQGQILVFATHSPELLSKFCTRAAWLHKGALMMEGSIPDVWKTYSEFTAKEIA